MNAARHDPRHAVGAGDADGDFRGEGSVAHPALAVVARRRDIRLAAGHGDVVRVVAGVVVKHRAVGEDGVERLGDVVPGIVERREQDAFAIVGIAVAVEIVETLEREEVVVRPAVPFLAPAELGVDPDEVGNLGAVVAECVVVVARDHPGPAGLTVVPCDVVAGEVDHRDADVGERVGVAEIHLALGSLVVTPDVHDALLGPKVFPVPVEVADIAFQRTVGRLLDAVVEESHRVVVGPVRDLVPGAQNFRENKGTLPVDIVPEHVGVVVVVGVTAAQALVVLRLVKESVGIVSEKFPWGVLPGVKPQAVVVDCIAEPRDPAVQHVAGLLVLVPGGIVGILVVLADVPEERFAGDELRAVGRREPVVGAVPRAGAGQFAVLRADVLEVAQVFPHRPPITIVVVPVAGPGVVQAHPGRALVVQPVAVARVVPDVEVRDTHAGVFADVRPVAGVVHDDVGDDLHVALVHLVDHVAQGSARAVAGGPRTALGRIAEIKPVVEAVPDVAPFRAKPGRRLRRRGSPDVAVAGLRHLGSAPVHFIPFRLEPLKHDFGLGAQCENKCGAKQNRFADRR